MDLFNTRGFAGRKVILMQVGQFDTTYEDVMMAGAVIENVWGKIR